MTDKQFKQLMEKLDAIQKQMDAGQWRHLYQQPYMPQQPLGQPWNPAQPWQPSWPIGGGGTRD